MNHIRAHWRGEHSLKVAFGLNVLGVTILWHLLGAALSGMFWSMNPYQSATASTFHLFLQVPLTIWQLVGLWRASGRLSNNGWTVIASWMARVVGVLVIMVGSVRFVTFGYSDHLYLAGLYSGMVPDPFGEFEVSLLDSGSILRFQGGIGVGSAERIERLIAQSSHISSVILQSQGGWVYEGLAIHRVISDASVSTYVFGECSSVCAIAFAAGDQRYISTGSRVGFHRFRGMTEGFDASSRQREAASRLSEAEVAPALIDEMFAIPPDRLWYPSEQRLLGANFVSGVVSCYELPPVLASACRDESDAR